MLSVFLFLVFCFLSHLRIYNIYVDILTLLNYVDSFKYVDWLICLLPKWKKDAKEFKVSINYNESRGFQSSIPKPIIEKLGNPEALKFIIKGNTVEIKKAKQGE